MGWGLIPLIFIIIVVVMVTTAMMFVVFLLFFLKFLIAFLALLLNFLIVLLVVFILGRMHVSASMAAMVSAAISIRGNIVKPEAVTGKHVMDLAIGIHTKESIFAHHIDLR